MIWAFKLILFSILCFYDTIFCVNNESAFRENSFRIFNKLSVEVIA